MQTISTLTLTPLRPGDPAGTAALRAWQAGQILQATVTAVASNGQVQLRIQQQSLAAHTQLPLKPGQTLELEVMRPGPQPVLKLLPPPPATDPQQQALRQALPRQGSHAPLLSNLAGLADKSATRSGETSALTEQAQRLYSQLPDRAQLGSATGLRRALENSGVFLEARLARLAAGERLTLDGDFKAQLLRLAQTLRATGADAAAARGAPPAPDSPPPLRGAPPQAQPSAPSHPTADSAALRDALLGQIDASLARVKLSQLASLGDSAMPQTVLSIEVPIRHERGTDLLALQIREDENGADAAAAKSWSVHLALDLPALGIVHAQVGLAADRVSTRLWAERGASAATLRAHLDELRAAFDAKGLQVGALHCETGGPPPPDERNTPRLLDTRA